jgi:nucleoid-associated protein YgaU
VFHDSKISYAGHRPRGGSWLFALLALSMGTPVYSQSLGEIARQERERKQQHPSQATHVYDNDDLARPHILLPEDEKRVQAKKKVNTPPAGYAPVETVDSAPKVSAPVSNQIAPAAQDVKSDLPVLGLHSMPPQPKPETSTATNPDLSQPPVTVRPRVKPSTSRTTPAPTQTESVSSGTQHQEISGDTQVRVQPGDTLWKLASKYLGAGKDWQALAACNPQVKNPMRLQVGTLVRLPDETAHSESPVQVVVKRGDSLWKLAQAHLGDGKAWNCVAQANPGLQNSNLIFAGQIVAIPENCASSLLTRAPHSPVSPKTLSVPTAQLLR